MTTTHPFRLIAASVVAALALGACASEPEAPEEPAAPVEVSIGEADTEVPVGPDDGEAGAEEVSEVETDAPQAEVSDRTSPYDEDGEWDPVPFDQQGPDYHDHEHPMPQGQSIEEWGESFREGSRRAGDYMQARYEISYRDAAPNMWLVNTRDLVTDEWYQNLQSIIEVSGGMGADAWEEFQEDEVVYNLQLLQPITVDTTRPFGKDEMTLQVPYRTWENSRFSRDGMPKGWTRHQGEVGAPGTEFTAIHLVRDHDAGEWLVNSEGLITVTGLGH